MNLTQPQRPANWPAIFTVGTRVTHFSRAHRRFAMEHKIVLADGAVAAVASGEIAAMDYDAGRATELPSALRDAIEAFEGRQLELLE